MVLQSLNSEPGANEKIVYNRFLAFQISFPLLGGFLFGYNTGVISGALLLLKNEFHLSVYSQEAVVTSTIIAAAISSFFGGVIAERFGRKTAILLSSMFSICGSVIMGIASSINIVIVGRVIVGIGIGLAGSACPVYIAEVSPEEIRGRLIVLYQITIAGGQFVAAIINALFYFYSKSTIWRYMLGFSAIPAFIQAFGLVFIPESHRWLISKNKIRKAKKIIKKEGRIAEDSIDVYVDDILVINEEVESPLKEKNNQQQNIFYQILHNKVALRSLFIGCGIQMIQQIIGINGLIYYSSSIINMAGIFEVHKVLWYTVLVMFFCFFPIIIGFVLIDRIGRRKLAMFSLLGIVLSTVILASGFQVMYNASDPVTKKDSIIHNDDDISCYNKPNCEACVTIHTCGYCRLENKNLSFCLTVNPKQSNESLYGPCSEKNDTIGKGIFNVGFCQPHYATIIIVGMMLYLLSFSAGMGPVPWTVTSEIYPLWCRSINMAVSSTVNWTFNILISMTFLSLTEWISRYGVFWLFSAISLCSLGLIYKWLPETNQLTLEEVTKLMETT